MMLGSIILCECACVRQIEVLRPHKDGEISDTHGCTILHHIIDGVVASEYMLAIIRCL